MAVSPFRPPRGIEYPDEPHCCDCSACCNQPGWPAARSRRDDPQTLAADTLAEEQRIARDTEGQTAISAPLADDVAELFDVAVASRVTFSGGLWALQAGLAGCSSGAMDPHAVAG